MGEFLALLEEFKNSVFDIKIFCGILAAVVVFVIEIRIMNSHKATNRRVEKALRLGHVVQARRTKAWDEDTSGYSVDSWYHAKYVYTVNGSSYEYSYLGKAVPPMTMDLYYINHPRHAFSGTEKKHSVLSLLFYILPLAAAVLVIKLLGGV